MLASQTKEDFLGNFSVFPTLVKRISLYFSARDIVSVCQLFFKHPGVPKQKLFTIKARVMCVDKVIIKSKGCFHLPGNERSSARSLKISRELFQLLIVPNCHIESPGMLPSRVWRGEHSFRVSRPTRSPHAFSTCNESPFSRNFLRFPLKKASMNSIGRQVIKLQIDPLVIRAQQSK